MTQSHLDISLFLCNFLGSEAFSEYSCFSARYLVGTQTFTAPATLSLRKIFPAPLLLFFSFCNILLSLLLVFFMLFAYIILQ